MKPKWFDSLVGVVGLATSLTIYFIQGHSTSQVDYVIVLLPTFLAILFILIHFVIFVARHKWKELKEAKRFYDMITGMRCSSFTSVRIINTNGDISYDRLIQYKVTKRGIKIEKTATYTLSSTSNNILQPLPAYSVESNIDGIELSPILVSQNSVQIHGKDFLRCKWRYGIEPELKSKGDFLNFRFHTELPESEKNAFTENGSALYVLASASYADIGVSLISPPKYQIEILDAYFEDINGVREEITKESNPTLAGNKVILDWKPRYKTEGRYVCRYRLMVK